MREPLAWALAAGIVLSGSLAVRNHVFEQFTIPSESMVPTALVSDHVGAWKPAREPSRGEVIVFTDDLGWLPDGTSDPNPARRTAERVGLLPDSSRLHIIKRVIGVAGDTVEGSPDGTIRVNGFAIDESSYLRLLPGGRSVAGTLIPFHATVPDGHVFVMGDNRDRSADSRCHIEEGNAFVSLDSVVGKAVVITWPASRWGAIKQAGDTFSGVGPALAPQPGLDHGRC